ncbi:MAG: Uncharacterised protein [Bacteroidetes bacterium MED-G17]|nr:MAG: Uncharacterised protein [Bacteroidetes bacterium MED-G17]
MNTHADKTQENKNQAVSAAGSQMQNGSDSTFQFESNRPEAVAQRKLQEMANNNPRAMQLQAVQNMAINSPQAQQAKQLQSIADNHDTEQQQLIQKKENNTGLPDNLKSGIENLSGMSLDDVKVHRNSDKPAQLQAHAYAQGTDIHLGPGQEKHLPHEAWHVVQQKQGRVKPTMQMKEKVNVNDDAGLEREADVMGAKALQNNMGVFSPSNSGNINSAGTRKKTTQRVKVKTKVDTSGKKGKAKVLIHNTGWKDLIRAGSVKDGDDVIVDFDVKDGKRIAVFNSKDELRGYIDEANVSKDFYNPVVKAPDKLEEELDVDEKELKPEEGDRTLSPNIVEKLDLRVVGKQSVTTYDKAGAEAIERKDPATILYTPNASIKIYHGTKTSNENNIIKSGLDPSFGGSGGAKGLGTEPYNAVGYVYAAWNLNGAKAAAMNFFESASEEDKAGGFTVIAATISPGTILVQDPDLASAVRTTSLLMDLNIECRYNMIKGKLKEI